eukprot:3482833-Rhodomonas_salina.2
MAANYSGNDSKNGCIAAIYGGNASRNGGGSTYREGHPLKRVSRLSTCQIALGRSVPDTYRASRMGKGSVERGGHMLLELVDQQLVERAARSKTHVSFPKHTIVDVNGVSVAATNGVKIAGIYGGIAGINGGIPGGNGGWPAVSQAREEADQCGHVHSLHTV